MVRDAAGNLYGTTSYGGSGGGSNCGNFGCGTLFKLDTTGAETVLHSFVGTDGHGPRGGSDPGRRGQLSTEPLSRRRPFNLWRAWLRNSFQAGYRRSIDGPLCLKGGLDGAQPIGNLARDSHGNLYGNTYEGGSSDCFGPGCGTLFKVNMNGTETILQRLPLR